MPDVSPIDYASPAPAAPARAKLPVIVWWFLVNGLIFFGAVCYLMAAYERVGPNQELPPRQAGILNLWVFLAQAMFMFLFGWACCGWWRSRRAG